MSLDKEYFPITSLHREDLNSIGFDISNIDDGTMERIASKMANDYLDQLYWSSLEIIADALDVPRKGEKND